MIKRRKDSFFGLHFDCHATPDSCAGLKFGDYLKPEDIEKICDDFSPDFLQIDCKGHPGYTSYPTKIGTPAAEFSQDTLKVWREVTKRKNVALYMHYSGIWDTCWLQSHPEDANETPEFADVPDWLRDKNYTSAFSGYVDNLMIPQLKELSDYGVDGVWVDGDCWAFTVDCSARALDAFHKQTGIKLEKDDIVPENKYFLQYKNFCRDNFKKYLAHYTDELHKYNPEFQVASNWAYSEQMPEKVDVDVDFLSGDFNPNDSFNGALFGGRILASQGKPWDLMAWGFRRKELPNGNLNFCAKHSTQLMQEAASILSIGGGFQVYIRQNKDASPIMPLVNQIKPVADFCHKRKDFCKDIKTVPNVVIFNSTVDHYNNIPGAFLYGNQGLYNPFYGWSKLLADAGHSFEIREEHNLLDCINQYKVVICPEVISGYEKSTVDTLIDYAFSGGVLVLGGTKTLDLFKERLGLKYSEVTFEAPDESIKGTHQPIKPEPILTVDGEYFDQIDCSFSKIENDGDIIAKIHKSYRADSFGETYDFAKAIDFGKGKIIAIGGDFATDYNRYKTVTARKLAEKLFDYYKPTARATNSNFVVLNSAEKDGKLLIQLVNSAGEHSNDFINSFDSIPALYELKLEVNTEKKPESVTLQPAGIPLEYEEDCGKLLIKVPKVEIHEIVEIKFA